MDEMDLILPPNLDSALNEFYAGSLPDLAFATRLEGQLRQRHNEIVSPRQKPHFPFADTRRSFMQTLRARPILAVIVAILALLALTGIAYAISRLAGFIPGVGFVEDVQSVLEEPVVIEREALATPEEGVTGGAGLSESSKGLATQDRDGITLTIQEVVAETDRTVVVYKVTGLPPDLFGIDRAQEQSEDQAEPLPGQIRLPDGTILEIKGGSSCRSWGDGVRSALTCRLEFPPLPAGVGEFTLEVRRLQHALPGELPEDWQIPVGLAPVSPARMAGGVEEPDLRSQPVDGITLVLLKAAQTPTNTAFQLGLEWEGQGRMVHHTAPLTLQDARGRYYILSGGPEGGSYSSENPNFSTLPSLVTTPVEVGEPLTFRLDWIIMSAFGQASFEFDPGEDPRAGQEWTLNEEVQAGGFDLHFTTARLKEAADGMLTLEFDVEAPKGITGVNLFPNAEISSGGESGFDKSREILVSRVTLEALPDRPLELQISEVLYKVEGPWEIAWVPAQVDFAPYPTPTPAPTRMPGPGPTLVPGEPLLYELQAALENAYDEFQKRPGWVRQVIEVEQAEDIGGLDTGDLPEQPRHSLLESWVRLDEQGYVRTQIYIRKSLDGEFISADVNDGVVHFSLPEGRGGIGEDVYLAAPSFDFDLITILNGYLASGGTLHQETGVLDEKTCQLYEITRLYDPPQVFGGEPAPVQVASYSAWVDPESGKVLQIQNGMTYTDGSLRVKTTTRFLSLERLASPSDEVRRLLEMIIMP